VSATSDLIDTPEAGGVAIRGGALQLGGYIVGTAAAVVPAALLLRHLGVVETGEYVTVLSLVSLTGGLTEAGLAAIGVRELSTLTGASARRFFANLIGLRLVFAAAGVLVALAFAALSGYDATLVLGTLLAGAGQVLASTQVSYVLPLLARLRFRATTAVDVLRQLATAATVIALVLVGAPLLAFWAATIPAALATIALASGMVRRFMPVRPAFDRSVSAPIVRRTLPYSMATAVGLVYFRLAILVMSHVTGGHQTGYYGASFRVVEVLFLVPQILVGSALPIFARAARDDRERLRYALGRTVDACLLLGLATSLALVTGASFIVAVIAGPKFAPAVPVMRIQGVALIGTFLGASFTYGLLSLGRYREMLTINLLVLALSGVLTAVLAAAHGATGAATATTAVEALYTVALAATLVCAGVRPGVSISRAWRAVLAALLGLLAMVPAGLPSVARPLMALSVYGAGLLVLRAVPGELLEQIPGLRGRVAG
jgi:O-antigen/teichoic acid export membrane protein